MADASAITPDLHHKMSKKIAQLTKVIYHLNTMNEDNSFSLEASNAAHSQEIQTILKDASAKINRFREQIDEKRNEVNAHAQIEQLKKKHEQEKRNALATLEEHKSKFEEDYANLKNQTEDKVLNLRDEVASYKSKLADSMRQFDDKVKEMRSLYDKNKGVSNDAVDALKKKHEQEIAELVQSHNSKFQNMLVEQMSLQDTIKAELLEDKRNALGKLKEEHAQALGKLRAELNANNTESLEKLRREMTQQMEQQRSELLEKLNKAVNDVAAAKKECAEYASALSNTENLVAAAEKEIEKLKREIVNLKEELSSQAIGADGEARILKQKNSELRTQLGVAQEDIERLEKEYKKFTGESQAAQAKLLNDLSKAHEQLAKSKKEGKDFQNEIELLTSNLSAADTEGKALKVTISDLNKASEKLAVQTAKEKDKLNDTVKSLEEQIAKLKQSMGDSGNKLQSTIDGLNKKMEELKVTHIKALKAADEDFGKRMNDAKKAFEEESKVAGMRHADELKKKEEEIFSMKSSHESALSAERMRVTEAVKTGERKVYEAEKEAEAAMKAAEEEWNKERNQLNTRIAQLSSNSAAEADLLKGDLSKFKKQTEEMAISLTRKSDEIKKLNGISADLKNEIDNLRKELESNAAAAKMKMEAELGKLKEYYEGIINKNDAGNAEMLMKLEMEKKEELEFSLASLREELTKLLEDEKAAHTSTENRLSTLLFDEKSAHQKTIDTLNDQIQKLKDSHASSHSSIVEAHRIELEALQKRLSDEHDMRLSEAKSAHDIEQRLMHDNHALEKKNLEIAAKDELDEALRRKAEEELKKLQAADTKLKDELAKLEKELKDAHAEKLEGIKGDLHKDIEELTSKLTSTRYDLEEQTTERQSAQREVIELKAEISRLNSDYKSTMSQMKSDHEKAISDLNKSHDNRLEYESEQHSSHVLDLQNQHAEHIASKNGEISSLQSDIETLNERWLARESRPEDLERIEHLERELIEKDTLVKKTREEMVYFKRELLNREENFNKKFNTNPNVGVMSVIKPKNPGKGDPKKRRNSGLPPPPGAKGLAKENRRASGPVFGL
mmetsp:Transcript_9508/g.19347  ORF Transcript_9508/g.19347 Transcript_9508/m.19347 type:complete len:1073 (-) Transcript_9508:33-3251(-)|eukprot:CAMPEP_0118645548 /NCGR_PEP_ID=MMETSP0785-20121206/7564_1 /TAXON_ID=91992 /ORGANISM="Bolidomonas pacifica, Strain CCMP 1866" /LENGTH=1072 /DNA_ID=CAMNT_0006537447 /DNA_START=120 /DNA_END=3338 /DNA_ORIENTATION=-